MPGMELWAIIPELILGGLVLVLLPLGPLLSRKHKSIASWLCLAGLGAAGTASAAMLGWSPHPVFHGTYAVDPFAVFFKLFAISATGFVLLATIGHFRGQPHEGEIPALLALTCLGLLGLSGSQDLALIALFLQLITIGTYTLVGALKDARLATEGALKLYLFSAAGGAVMVYGMSLLYGLTGTLELPEIADKARYAPALTIAAAAGLVLVGYGFKITLVPFHTWAPDTYQGAATPISGYLSVAPKAAALAVLLRTLTIAFPGWIGWDAALAVLAALTMTVGNLFALRQSSAKRLLAYSSIGQAGYLLVGVAAAQRHGLATPGLLVYLAVYLFMNLGAFLAVHAIESQVGTDELESFQGAGRNAPLASAVLALCLLSLAGFPPLGGYIGKVMLLGAAVGVGWTWLAVIMVINVALSLAYYARVLQTLYLRSGVTVLKEHRDPIVGVALVTLGFATLLTGIWPQPLIELAQRGSTLLGAPAATTTTGPTRVPVLTDVTSRR